MGKGDQGVGDQARSDMPPVRDAGRCPESPCKAQYEDNRMENHDWRGSPGSGRSYRVTLWADSSSIHDPLDFAWGKIPYTCYSASD